MELLGCVGRQQFEETWMALLSVLNSTPNEQTPAEEVPFINLVCFLFYLLKTFKAKWHNCILYH